MILLNKRNALKIERITFIRLTPLILIPYKSEIFFTSFSLALKSFLYCLKSFRSTLNFSPVATFFTKYVLAVSSFIKNQIANNTRDIPNVKGVNTIAETVIISSAFESALLKLIYPQQRLQTVVIVAYVVRMQLYHNS